MKITKEIKDNGSVSLGFELKDKTIESLDEYDKIYTKIESELNDEETLTSLFKRQLEASFKLHPEVNAVRWNQYTPYFNDGEPCTFSGPYSVDFRFDKPEPVNNEKDDESDSDYDKDDDEEFVSCYSYSSLPKEEKEKLKKIEEDFSWITRVNNNFMLTMFGDDALVTITRDLEIQVSEYSHD